MNLKPLFKNEVYVIKDENNLPILTDIELSELEGKGYIINSYKKFNNIDLAVRYLELYYNYSSNEVFMILIKGITLR